MGIGVCPYNDCQNRTDLGYCKTTACINPKYNRFTFNTASDYKYPKSYITYTIPNEPPKEDKT